jgi:ERCC4-related helicase
MYVLPNRKAFSDSITRIFLKYRKANVDPLDTANSEEDMCKRQGDMSKNSSELFEYQKIVRDYLILESPYRGLLLYHGLGSGKTCSSIAVAESLLSTKKVYIMLPASLQDNYRGEIRKCGDPIYKNEQFWELRALNGESRAQAKGMGISDLFLDSNGKFFINVSGRPPNYDKLQVSDRELIDKQINDILNQRFTFINYNGISKVNFDKIFPPDQPHMFDNSVVIIDEAHNLIGGVVSEREIKMKVYNMIYKAKDCKVVCLSGTPVVNRPNEISYLMNLLRGPIERVTVATTSAISWDESLMTAYFRRMKDVDTIEYNSIKRTIMLTRNPPHFESVYNEKNERIAVKYNKEFDQEVDIKKWVTGWKTKFESEFAGMELAKDDKYAIEELECLPTKFEDFVNTFVDGLSIKNALMFQKRIQGLVSYFKGADERLLPRRIDEENTLVRVPMSEQQFMRYLELRWEEIKRDAKKGRQNADLNEDYGSYRMASRLVCNYAVPSEMRVEFNEATNEESDLEKPEILEKLKANPERFLSEEALKTLSPKMLRMLQDIKKNIGTTETRNNQFIYSQYRSLEGLGIFSAILEANGFQEYKLVKKQGIWEEDPSMKKDVPAYALFVGGTGDKDKELRELYRQIFNESYEQNFPQSLKDSIKERRLCVFMASSAGAEGITLKNVRNVLVMEAYWNPSRIEQVIGRAIRICSHASLPIPERTVDVKFYLSVFSEEQAVTGEGPNVVLIRRNDMVLKRYEGGEPKDAFMSSDEFLYEVSYKKGRIIKNISLLLKQAAIDCEIHRKLHAKESPVIQCMRFDTTATSDDLAFNPSYKSDEKDTLYLRNITRKSRRLQRVLLQNILIILDPDTNEVFDAPAFEDTKRLIRLGIFLPPNQVQFFTSGSFPISAK